MVSWQFFSKRDETPQFFFSMNEKKQIEGAIAEVEKNTSAEVRVHVEFRKNNFQIIDQASQAFERLGMTKTQARNGVLIFICPNSREFAVLGDTAIHAKVPGNFWNDVSRELAASFQKNLFAEGVVAAINRIGEYLQDCFPDGPTPVNQLPNHISFG